MKKIFTTLILVILTISCSDQTLNADNAIDINGTIYKKGSLELFTGKVVTKHKNGQIIRESNYRNGKEHGRSMFYFPNGSKEFIANYQNGIEHGVTTFWRKNGYKEIELTYNNGMLNGPKTWFFSNGEKMKQYNYKNNQLEGSSTWWGKSGKIWEEKPLKTIKK